MTIYELSELFCMFAGLVALVILMWEGEAGEKSKLSVKRLLTTLKGVSLSKMMGGFFANTEL